MQYHERHGTYAGAAWHRNFLDRGYRLSYAALQRIGCDPLARSAPRVLLCGTGAPATTVQFTRFVHERRPSSRLYVLDLAQPPLAASRDALLGSPLPAAFVRADGRALPFRDGTLDLIETDFLLQFLSDPDRFDLLKEWRRVLRADGAFMTRDWVTHGRGLDPVWDGARRFVLRAVLGARTHVLTATRLRELLAKAGFQASIMRMGRVPLIHVVTGVKTR